MEILGFLGALLRNIIGEKANQEGENAQPVREDDSTAKYPEWSLAEVPEALLSIRDEWWAILVDRGLTTIQKNNAVQELSHKHMVSFRSNCIEMPVKLDEIMRVRDVYSTSIMRLESERYGRFTFYPDIYIGGRMTDEEMSGISVGQRVSVRCCCKVRYMLPRTGPNGGSMELVDLRDCSWEFV